MSILRRIRHHYKVILLCAVLIVAVIFPFQSSSYNVYQLSMVGVYTVALVGLCLITGTAGQITLGHSFFFAVGAFISAGLIVHGGVPELLTIPISAIAAFALGWIFGVPALRLKGLYLAIVTLSIAIAAPPLARRFEAFTGGSAGTNIGPVDSPAESGLAPDQWLYLVVLAIAAICMAIGYALLKGPFGRAMRAVRDNEVAAAACGINVSTVKVQAFAIASMLAGVGGALYTMVVRYVAPDSFTLVLSVMMLAALVVGGMRSLLGAVLGAVFLQYVPSLSGDINVALSGVVFGVLLILLVIFMPEGASGLLKAIWTKITGGNSRLEPSDDPVVHEPEHQVVPEPTRD